MKARNSSPLSVFHKLNTDRSENILYTTRTSQSSQLDNHIQKNASEILHRNQINAQAKRKDSMASYYFKNCKKGSKVSQVVSFSKYLKNKNVNIKRNRCITTVELTTNKNSLSQSKNESQNQIQHQSTQKVIKITSNQSELRNRIVHCKNHPQKWGYFEEAESFDCYCHQCSIQCVKNNKRLIQVLPQMTQVKNLISNKIQEAEQAAYKLCEIVLQKVKQSNSSLEKQYHAIKFRMLKQNNQDSSHLINQLATENSKNSSLQKKSPALRKSFNLQQIELNFMKNICNYQPIQNLKQLSFLKSVNKTYQLDLKKYINVRQFNFQQQNCKSDRLIDMKLKNEINMKSKPLRDDKVFINDKISNGLSSNNLVKQIQKALYYPSAKPKVIKKTIHLRDKSFNLCNQNQNKENISPNSIKIQKYSEQENQKYNTLTSSQLINNQIMNDSCSILMDQEYMPRISFGVLN